MSGERLSQTALLVNVLNLCLGIWFLGNTFITLHELLISRERMTSLLRAWDVLAMTGVAILPAALLHAHLSFFASIDNYRTLTPTHVRRIGLALYLPAVFLPYAIYRIVTGPYRPFLLDMGPLLVPYSIWYATAMWSSALLDWAVFNRLDPQAKRERTFFKQLAVLLVLNGAFQFYVVTIYRAGPDDYLWVAFVLASLLPIFFVAYHVYRYRLVDVAIKDSLVYAVFALLFIAVYTYGVRQLDEFLVEHFQIRPGVVEVLLLLGMVALASPVVRAIDKTVHRLFTREIGLYRDVVRQVASGAEGFGELDALIRYTEETIRRGLDLASVRVMPVEKMKADSHERRLANKMIEWQSDLIENDEELQALDASAAYALRREGALIGLMIISADLHTLTSEKRAILDVLAGQVSVEVESCRLIEEKVRLERKLSERERLATLGQMAAQVAHEVKNPLSAIKSIAQVMREEDKLKDYEQDLSLIVSEIDRLNRTVSQLLAFSRPSRADLRPVALAEVINSTVTLAAVEAAERGVEIKVDEINDVTLTGAQAGALREALSNLVINAVQATDSGGEVRVESDVEVNKPAIDFRSAALKKEQHRSQQSQGAGATAELILTVTDTGPGIAAEARQKVFEPFYSTKSRGTGLGLAIVQRRVVELGGMVELTSPVESNRGARFRLRVPLAPSSTQD